MSDKQKVILIVGAVAALLMMLFPPYVIPGRLIDDVVYGLIWKPPASIYPDETEYQVTMFTYLLNWQLGFVGTVTAIALRGTARSRTHPAFAGCAAELGR